MKKIISTLPLLSLLLATSSCNGNYKYPSFESGKQIEIIAYAGPCVKVYNGVNTQTDENFKKVAEAGFTHVLALWEGNYDRTNDKYTDLARGHDAAYKVSKDTLDYCEKYGLKYYVRDWNIHGMGVAEHESAQLLGIDTTEEIVDAMKYIFPDDCEYIHHPAYAGNYICDEPFYYDLHLVGETIRAYKDRLAELGVTGVDPYINLNPVGANSSKLGGNYTTYIDKYLSEIADEVGYISYDFYPFKEYSGEPLMKPLYLYNLQYIANSCNANNLTMRTHIQAKGDYTGLRDLTSMADFRLQAYCNLAFGSYNMTYYEYGGLKSENEGQYSLFDVITGEYNWSYNAAKTVNRELHAIENVITNYRYDNILYKSVDDTYENNAFLNLDNYLESHDRVAIKTVSEDTFLTTMKNVNDDSDAFMLVNYSDPAYNKTDTVTLRFKNTKALLMYRLGQKMIVNLPSSGQYTFKLGAGEGRFIIPLN